jgi:class 3 adenylate cyclase
MAREQRKLAAILAADVVGYSRLMGRDESGTLARLPSIARNVWNQHSLRRPLLRLMGDVRVPKPQCPLP